MEKYLTINENGCSIRCKLICKDMHTIQQMIIFCHGFGGHKDNHAASRFAEHLISKYKTAALLAFDWPAHGQDAKGKLRLSDCELYLQTVVDYIKNQYTDHIYVYGNSFGAYITLKYIHDHGNPFQKIAFRSPSVDMYYTLTNKVLSPEDLKKLSKGKDVLAGFDRKVKIDQTYLDEIKDANIANQDFIPYCEDILMIHGSEDEVVPYESIYQFADNNIIELITVKGADHRFRNPKVMDAAHNDILKFFNL